MRRLPIHAFHTSDICRQAAIREGQRIFLTSNTDPAQTFLTIKGEITAPEGDAAIKPQPIKPAAPAQK